MPIEKVKFEKLFPTAQYANELFSMEGTIGPSETKESLYDEMYQTAMFQFYKNNPHLQEQQTIDLGVYHSAGENFTTKTTEDFKPISFIDQVQTCTSPTVLKALKQLAKTEYEERIWGNKMEELLTSEIKNK